MTILKSEIQEKEKKLEALDKAREDLKSAERHDSLLQDEKKQIQS